MNKCRKYGIDVTKRCNWRCKTCFYFWEPDFNGDYQKPLSEAIREVENAKAKGCNHSVIVGFGEPGLWPNLIDWIKAVRLLDMTCSIITNGSLATSHYGKMREAGLDHLHISMHGLGKTLDDIVGVEGAGEHQKQLREWLYKEQWPFRINMTVQQLNYTQVLDIFGTAIDHGARHVVSLGFLPHYGWGNREKIRSVAVHPETYRYHLESAISFVEAHNETNPDHQVMMSVRYHPMCHIRSEYRKYITNAKYVVYDPFEWQYNSSHLDGEELWRVAEGLGTVGSHEGECAKCDAWIHCNGWNKGMIIAFDGAELKPITLEDNQRVRGFYHDQNPTNSHRGWFHD